MSFKPPTQYDEIKPNQRYFSPDRRLEVRVDKAIMWYNPVMRQFRPQVHYSDSGHYVGWQEPGDFLLLYPQLITPTHTKARAR